MNEILAAFFHSFRNWNEYLETGTKYFYKWTRYLHKWMKYWTPETEYWQFFRDI